MLDELAPRPGARKGRKRAGRGPGSGLGKTAGRGTKGQGKRSAGRETPIYFEGGQMPLARRLPKRGFTSRQRQAVEIVNTGDLAVFGEGATVDVESLVRRGLVRGNGSAVKLLGEGDAPRQIRVQVHRASAGARAKVEAAGGTVELIG
jgi:large subunit ribosomal protein L15